MKQKWKQFRCVYDYKSSFQKKQNKKKNTSSIPLKKQPLYNLFWAGNRTGTSHI